MRQVTGLTSTYSSDEFGICSALYELGGMVVMHDASGCNSTYTTHDEPRWYDMDSMIFISAISETEAVLGDDDKLIDDLIETAQELHPEFIALVGAPIPYMIGTDLEAVSRIVSRKTGICCFAFSANGMRDYTVGVSMAMERIVREYAHLNPEHPPARSCSRQKLQQDAAVKTVADENSEKPDFLIKENRQPDGADGTVVNIIGATPLDFSLNGSVSSVQRWIADHGMKNGVCLAMGCTLDDVKMLGTAQVNLVVSAGGLAAAKLLRERFGTPYVVGVPVGERFSAHLEDTVREAVRSSESCISYKRIPYRVRRKADAESGIGSGKMPDMEKPLAIIGESVFSASLAAAIEMEHGAKVRVLCPLEIGPELLRPDDLYTPEEDDLIRALGSCAGVIADPLYRSLLRGQDFYPLPHEAFSGRMYDSVNPNLIAMRLKNCYETNPAPADL